jgi:toxin ParE1/3/4
MSILRTENYNTRLSEIFEFITLKNETAALTLVLDIDDQVDQLQDANFPHRLGRVAGTRELVARPNYIVLLRKTGDDIVAFDIVHAAQDFP